MVTKSIRVAEKRRLIRGISPDDPYFLSLSDDTETQFVDVCRRCVPPDAVCLDIGANIGVTTLALSAIAFKGRVYSFEPSPTVYPLLLSNLTENHCRNVDAKQFAISDADGGALFNDNSAYGHIATSGVQVPAYTLATIVTSLGLDRLDFIKIDTEGFEFKILKSGYEVITKFNSVVYFEFNTWALLAHSRTDPVEFLEWIFDNFRCVAKVDRASPNAPLAELERSDLLKFLYENMLDHGCVNDLVVAATMTKSWPGAARAALENFHIHNDTKAELRGHLSFTTPPKQWHYAISIDCLWMQTGTAVELDVQVDSGSVGFGFNDRALSRYLTDEIVVRPQDGRRKVKIVLTESVQRAALVARNVSSDGKSQATVFSLHLSNASQK